MPPYQAELNMRLFADRTMPVLQRDTAFAGPVAVPKRAGTPQDDVFAPA